MLITLMQWNIWYKEDPVKIVKFMKKFKADIFCLQELTINSKDQAVKNVPKYIAEQLGYSFYYKELPIESTDGSKLMFANGIFSKFPILSSEYIWINQPSKSGGYDDEYRAYVQVTLDTGVKELIIGTTHMSYTHKFVTTLSKKQETDILLNQLSKHKNSFIFTGDLNATSDSHTINSIEKLMKNAGPQSEEKSWTTKPFSYNGFDASTLDWRLDYVFTTKDINVVSSEILDTPFSDHLPILTTLKLP